MSKGYFHPDADYFRKVLKTEPPKATAHATEEEIAQNMKRLIPNTWVLRGNQLEGMTEQGKLVQTIPTSYILEGTDSEGLPIFKEIVVQ
jgi:hypothetical protein